ncbi:MAG: lipoprotein [Azonexus sp.]|nr:lipoprotein [Azonexus sp.]MCK6412916.1 lipoprotein [Azonexus sp.]
MSSIVCYHPFLCLLPPVAAFLIASMYRFAAILLALLASTQLGACGQKGPLILPPGPVPEPLFGQAKHLPQAAPGALPADVSTPRKDTPQ